MTLYVDSSAWFKRYVNEIGSSAVDAVMASDSTWATARHTLVEVHRALGRVKDEDESSAREFDTDWGLALIVELDLYTCALAKEFALETGVRTLDALHLAAAWRVGNGNSATVLTFDRRLASAARTLGFPVVGA